MIVSPMLSKIQPSSKHHSNHSHRLIRINNNNNKISESLGLENHNDHDKMMQRIFNGRDSAMYPKIEKYLDQLEMRYEQAIDDYFTDERRLIMSQKKSPIFSFDIKSYSSFQSEIKQIEQETQELLRLSDQHLVYLVDKQMLRIRLSKYHFRLKEERMHHFWQVFILIQSDFRHIFGVIQSEQCGDFFLDSQIARIVHEYAYNTSHYEKHTVDEQGCLLRIHHSSEVLCSAISSDGRYLFTGGIYGIDLTDLWSETLLCPSLNAHSNSAAAKRVTGILTLAYSSGFLVSGGMDSNIVIWDAFNLKPIRTLIGHTSAVNSVDFGTNKYHNSMVDRVISASSDHSIREWSLLTGQCLRVFQGHRHSVQSARVLDSAVVSCSLDGSLRLWNPLTARMVHCCTSDEMMSEGTTQIISDVCVNSDGSLLVCVSPSSSLTVLDALHLSVVRRLRGLMVQSCFHPTLPYVLAVAEQSSNAVLLYDVVSGHCLREWHGHSGFVNGLCFDLDGSKLVSVSSDGTSCVWSLSFLFDRTHHANPDPIDFLFFG